MTEPASPCPACACVRAHPAHAVLASLCESDLDAALALGLLDAQPCPTCTPECSARLRSARDARRFALDARERYRNRAARLARIKAEREAARQAARPPVPASESSRSSPAAIDLPKVASDALAKALARAHGRHA